MIQVYNHGRIKMKKYILLATLFLTPTLVLADETKLAPEFQGETWNSKYKISYDDLNNVLDLMVLDTGLSNRDSMSTNRANIGTKLKASRNKHTGLEANRFYFEAFKTDELKSVFTKIRQSLEQLPTELPLKELKRKEQLAYWLNLYNVTVLEQLINRYPIAKLEDELTDDDSFLNEKLLTVAGHKLSLKQIQDEILFEKFGDKPTVIYGLYQGNIGSPNIRTEAYTGDKVDLQLERNATEFINSNRGVFRHGKNKVRVSQFYEQHAKYFPNFKEELVKHLSLYLKGEMKTYLLSAKRITADMEDWSITDVYGSMRSYGTSANNNSAAILDSASANSTDSSRDGSGGGVSAFNLALISDQVASRTISFGRFSAEQADMLRKIQDKKTQTGSSVTVTDLSSDDKNDN